MKANDAAGQREHQRDRVVCDFARAIVGRIAHRDTGAGRRFQVDVVEADTGADDYPAFWDFGHHCRRNFGNAAGCDWPMKRRRSLLTLAAD
jgi:hypothetical protein